MIGQTNSQGGGGGASASEKINISLTTNQQVHEDLLGAIIKVTVNGNATEYVWEGSRITVTIPAYMNYSVEFGAVEDYAAPEKFSAAAVAGNARTVTAEYKTTVITASIKSNQSDAMDLADATISIGGKTLKDGQSAKFATGSSLTASFSEVEDYKKPDDQNITASGSSMTITGTYQTEVVSVTLNADNGESMNGQSVTINGKTSVWNGTPITQKVAFGTSYEISVDEKEDYIAPSSVSYTASQARREVVMAYAYHPTIDLSKVDMYGNPIAQNTANCYVIKNAGKYMFPIAYGAAIRNGIDNDAAYTRNRSEYSRNFVNYLNNVVTSPYIEVDTATQASDVQISIADTDNVLSELKIVEKADCRYVQFWVNSVPETGANAVISIKDADGVIMWSWHIWLWPYDLTPVEIVNATGVTYNIMPVNLATILDTADSINKTTGWKNWFYQWGRPNPMMCPAAYNSYEFHESYGSLNFNVNGGIASSLSVGIQNPATNYNEAWYSDGSWYDENVSDEEYEAKINLWDAACTSFGSKDNNVVKTIYDPSPVGFKMPNGNTFTGFFNYSTVNKIGSFDYGYKFKRYSGDTVGVFFPASGDGYSNQNDLGTYIVSSASTWGRIYTSSNYENNASTLYYHSNGAGNTSIEHHSTASVRPVKDENYALSAHKLTIDVSSDKGTLIGYEIGIYEVYERVDETTGEVTEAIGDLIALQTTASATYELVWGTRYKIVASDLYGFMTPQSNTYVADSLSRNVNVFYYKVNDGDLSMFDVHGNPITQTTANCYVVKKAGNYMFPIAYGAAIKNGVVNAASFTNNGGDYSHDFVNYLGNVITSPYVEMDTGKAVASVQMSISDTENAVTDLKVIEANVSKYVAFKVPSVPATGANAVISVKDADGVIMWSWHIWLWPYDLTPVEITNSTGVAYNIMPVNLATILDTADSINGTTGWKNWFYQWGRPNPMMCPAAYDSTSNHTSYGVLSYAAVSIASNIQTGIRNPATFYNSSSSYNYNWFQTNSGKTYNLWDAACTSTGNSDNSVVKTIYDPSPIGFKMPNGNTFTYFSTSNVVGSFANGWKFKRYSGDTVGVFFPASGWRYHSDGSLNYVDSDGYVWLSSAYSQNYAYFLNFRSNYVNPQSNNYRAYGYSVRPVTDTPIEGQNKRTKIRIDQTITDPEAMITRIVDLGGIEAVRANSHRYTGTFADGKMTLKQLDDADGTKYVDGTAADLTTIGTDVWMKLPQFHWKCTEHATDVWDFEVVYGAKPDDTYKTWDGNDLIGVYEAYNSSSKLYSVSGKDSTGSVSQANFKTYAQARGEGFSLVKWKHHCMMAMLYYTMYGHTNCQAKIGKGTSSYAKSTGATNSLGMTDTLAGGNGDSNSINFWGLENWWGNKYEWMDNIVVDARVWKITEDDGTVRTAGTGSSSSNWISKMLFGENMDLIPTAATGSETTGFCDYYHQSSSNSRVVLRSYYYAFAYGGVACVDAYYDSSSTDSGIGSRLAFRGECVIA